MKNNFYYTNGQKYGLGSLINGDAFGVIITSGGESDVYEVEMESGSVCLSTRYGFVNKKQKFINVEDLTVGESILKSDNAFDKVKKITKRTGVNIIIPTSTCNLNNFLVAVGESQKQCMDLEGQLKLQHEKFATCKFRTDEKITKEEALCCGRGTSVQTDFFCNKKQVLLNSPICGKCTDYQKK